MTSADRTEVPGRYTFAQRSDGTRISTWLRASKIDEFFHDDPAGEPHAACSRSCSRTVGPRTQRGLIAPVDTCEQSGQGFAVGGPWSAEVQRPRQ